jgi:hypothetical protein
LGYLPAGFWTHPVILEGFLVSFHAVFLPEVLFLGSSPTILHFEHKSSVIQGIPLLTIKELLGHKTFVMTERYSHLLPDILSK